MNRKCFILAVRLEIFDSLKRKRKMEARKLHMKSNDHTTKKQSLTVKFSCHVMSNFFAEASKLLVCDKLQ